VTALEVLRQHELRPDSGRNSALLAELLRELDVDQATLLAALTPRAEVPTIAEAAAAWLEALGVGKSPVTVRTYAQGLKPFLAYLVQAGVDPVTTCTTDIPHDAVDRWLVALHGQVGNGQTLRVYMSAVRSYLRFLEARRLEPRGMPYRVATLRMGELVGRLRYHSRRPDRRLPELIGHVLALSAPTPCSTKPSRRAKSERGLRSRTLELLRDRALLLTLWCTGARRAEVCSLGRSDLEDGRADSALIVGKGDKERVIFFDQPTLAAIRAYLEARADAWEPLFIRHSRNMRVEPGPRGEGYRLSPQSAWVRVRAYAAELGIPATPHAFRHARACQLLNAGASMAEVSAILGHDSLATTSKIYAKYDVRHLREVFDRCSGTLEGP
jgi:site-specific recombinase XerD